MGGGGCGHVPEGSDGLLKPKKVQRISFSKLVK